MNWKRPLVGTLGATITALALGYGSAWLQRDACEQGILREVSQRQIVGADFHGRRIALSSRDVYATISGPFMLEAGYVVPNGLHGTWHARRYWALPWGHYLRSNEHYELI